MIDELFKLHERAMLNTSTNERPQCCFLETQIYNEGWLLRIILEELKKYTGTISCRDYSQITRTVCCMIHALGNSTRLPEGAMYLAVLCPADNIRILANFFIDYSRASIRHEIKHRIRDYEEGESTRNRPQFTRFLAYWEEMLQKIEIVCLSWERIIEALYTPKLELFYQRCKIFNKHTQFMTPVMFGK